MDSTFVFANVCVRACVRVSLQCLLSFFFLFELCLDFIHLLCYVLLTCAGNRSKEEAAHGEAQEAEASVQIQFFK